MDAGADEGTTVPTAPLALVSGTVVVTDGAVLAGAAAGGDIPLVLASVPVFSFLPQAPSASNAETATTVAAVENFNDSKRIKISLIREMVDDRRQQQWSTRSEKPSKRVTGKR